MLQPSALTLPEQTELTCSSCHAPLHPKDVHYGHPFITARQLLAMILMTAIRAPKLLGELLLKELPPAPYCSECRKLLPAKRQAEQLKFMLIILLTLGLFALCILYTQGTNLNFR